MRRVRERLRSAGPWIAGVSAACAVPAVFFASANSDYALVPYKPDFIRVSPREKPLPVVLDLSVTEMIHNPKVEDVTQSPSPSLSLPDLPRYSSASYSPMQRKLFREGSEIVSEFIETRTNDDFTSDLIANGWEPCSSSSADDHRSIVLRRKFVKAGREVSRYCILGQSVVPAEQLHALLCDSEHRRNWDDSAQSIVTSQREISSNTVTLEWESKWPWPLAPRRYLFRQAPFQLGAARGVVCAGLPASAAAGVAVEDYLSISAILPAGGDSRFCLFYFDDPQLGKAPQWLEDYAARTLLPGFTRGMVQGGKNFPAERLQIYRDSLPQPATAPQPHPWEQRHNTSS